MPALDSAIDSFPIVAWLSTHTQVGHADTEDLYVDCPICGGKKKLGVARVDHYGSNGRLVRKGTANCFKCHEGGYGGEIWSGKASLPRFIKLLEGCSWRRAFNKIYELSGIPEPEFVPRKNQEPKLPTELIPLSECSPTEKGVQELTKRGVGHLIETSYVCLESGKYYERIIFPVYWDGELVGFEAKSVHKARIPSLFPPWMPTDSLLYTTRNWDSSSTTAVMTESIIDSETLSSFSNAVGCFGSFKEGQLERLIELGIETLVWAMDGDAWSKQVRAIQDTFHFFEHKVIHIEPDQDPNSLGSEILRHRFSQARTVRDELDLTVIAAEWGHL